MRPSMPVSRLEVRREWPVPRSAFRAGRERLCPKDQVEILHTRRARRRVVDLFGSARTAASAAGMGVRDGAAVAAFRLEADSGVQLAAGNGGWHRFQPRLIPA